LREEGVLETREAFVHDASFVFANPATMLFSLQVAVDDLVRGADVLQGDTLDE
jgi:hypothetical protein